MAESLDFTSLPDVRRLDVASQAEILAREAPSGYFHGAVPQEITPSQAPDMNGIDVLLVVLRRMYMVLGKDYRGVVSEAEAAGSEELLEIVRDEQQFPLLRLAWSNFSANQSSPVALSRIRHDIANLLVAEGHEGPSFWALAESPLMYSTLFKRKPFLLVREQVLSQRVDRPESRWVVSPSQPAHELAEEGLIHWDGRADLGKIISQKSGMCTHQSRRYFYEFNHPVVIRVLCRVPEDAPVLRQLEIAKQLRHLDIQASTMQRTNVEGQDCEFVTNKCRYTAAAIVRLRGSGELYDLVRTYTMEGLEIRMDKTFRWAESNWSFSTPGTSSMIYFIPAPARALTWHPVYHLRKTPEIAYRPADYKERLERMRRAASGNPPFDKFSTM
ncbi:hypothetical protein F4809DRAFT_589625 [Biscogniauxia mediterranea]|nr:hypothetical protein F4809DRAFT_589625 [Biscogniauxia mediterranea]